MKRCYFQFSVAVLICLIGLYGKAYALTTWQMDVSSSSTADGIVDTMSESAPTGSSAWAESISWGADFSESSGQAYADDDGVIDARVVGSGLSFNTTSAATLTGTYFNDTGVTQQLDYSALILGGWAEINNYPLSEYLSISTVADVLIDISTDGNSLWNTNIGIEYDGQVWSDYHTHSNINSDPSLQLNSSFAEMGNVHRYTYDAMELNFDLGEVQPGESRTITYTMNASANTDLDANEIESWVLAMRDRTNPYYTYEWYLDFRPNNDYNQYLEYLYGTLFLEGVAEIMANVNISDPGEFGTVPLDAIFETTVATSPSPTAPVPEPATLLLFGTGLVGLAGIGRKKLKNN